MSISNIKNTNILAVVCDMCFLSICDEPLVQCIECKIDLCIYCFSDSAEVNQHEKTHSYRIVLCSKKIECDWTILEELIFLNSLSSYGIGNWDFIAKSLGTKTEKEVETFFYKYFNIQKNVISNIDVCDRVSNPYLNKISIYMEKRKDFDVEYMNDYEEIIKDIEFFDSDDEIDTLVKKTILKGYDLIVNMRTYRKNIIINKQIVDIDENRKFDSKIQKYIDIEEYKFLLEYLTLNQYKKFVEGIYTEKKLIDNFEKTKKQINYNFVLSKNEKFFCKSLDITFETFATLKREIISNNINKGAKNCTEILEVALGNDVTKINKALEFFMKQNYFS